MFDICNFLLGLIIMKLGAIDSGQIQAMLNQLKSSATQGASHPSAMSISNDVKSATGLTDSSPTSSPSTSVSFSSALKASLDSISDAQGQADKLGKSLSLIHI